MTAIAIPGSSVRSLPVAGDGVDRAIRASTAAVVLAVAGIAAYISYWHACAVVREWGESGVTAVLEPATIDGLVYASSMLSGGPQPVARRCATRLAESFCNTSPGAPPACRMMLREPGMRPRLLAAI